MLSLMDVQCPHCRAQGRIITPPPGAIIVGPCPECQEMVVVFGGRVMPLDKAVWQNGSLAARKEHLLEVIGVFLDAKIEQMLHSAEEEPETGELAEAPADAFAPAPHAVEHRVRSKRLKPITAEEYSAFVQKELHLLDDPRAFRALFD